MKVNGLEGMALVVFPRRMSLLLTLSFKVYTSRLTGMCRMYNIYINMYIYIYYIYIFRYIYIYTYIYILI